MNCYILTEDEISLKKVLPFWLSYMNFPCTQRVSDISEITQNSYILQSGQGVYQLIDNVLYETLQTIIESDKIIDELIIFLDAEELLPSERLKEVEKKIADYPKILDLKCHIKIFVCNCCFESWLLCNSSLFPKYPPDENNFFYKFFYYYNIQENDPEQMNKPSICFPDTKNTKAGFHFSYFHEMCRFQHKRYRKRDPKIAEDKKFFNNLVKRVIETNHGKSFKQFYEYIINLQE